MKLNGSQQMKRDQQRRERVKYVFSCHLRFLQQLRRHVHLGGRKGQRKCHVGDNLFLQRRESASILSPGLILVAGEEDNLKKKLKRNPFDQQRNRVREGQRIKSNA